jgi:hypothetical protein
VQRMVEYAPSTGSLALWVHHRDDDRVAEAVVAATDGTTIRYGKAFEALPLPRQTGVVAHEVLHVALRHVPRFHALQRELGDVDLELFNICADAIVTSALSHLDWLEVDPRGVRLEELLTRVLGPGRDTSRVLLEWDVEGLYRAVDDRRPKGGRDRSKRTRKEDGPRARTTRALGSQLRRDLVPSPEAEEAPEAEAEAGARVARAHHPRPRRRRRALACCGPCSPTCPRSAPPGSSCCARSCAAALPAPRAVLVPPVALLPRQPGRMRSTVGGCPGSPAAYGTSGRPPRGHGRRLGLHRRPAAASASPAEIEAISRRMEARVTVIIGDDRVRSVVHLRARAHNLREHPSSAAAAAPTSPRSSPRRPRRPDIGVFLTDLDGARHHRPRWPVIWAVPAACRIGARASGGAAAGTLGPVHHPEASWRHGS